MPGDRTGVTGTMCFEPTPASLTDSSSVLHASVPPGSSSAKCREGSHQPRLFLRGRFTSGQKTGPFLRVLTEQPVTYLRKRAQAMKTPKCPQRRACPGKRKSPPGSRIPGPSSGRRPPKKSSIRSQKICHGVQARHTSRQQVAETYDVTPHSGLAPVTTAMAPSGRSGPYRSATG